MEYLRSYLALLARRSVVLRLWQENPLVLPFVMEGVRSFCGFRELTRMAQVASRPFSNFRWSLAPFCSVSAVIPG